MCIHWYSFIHAAFFFNLKVPKIIQRRNITECPLDTETGMVTANHGPHLQRLHWETFLPEKSSLPLRHKQLRQNGHGQSE